MIRFLFILLIAASLMADCETEAPSTCRGKIDVAPTYLKIDSVESGKTVDTHQMRGVRVGLDYFLWKALLFRGTGILAWGDARFQTYTAGIGACLPYKQFYFTPSAGVTYSQFSADIDFPELELKNLKQKFRSLGPYIGLDIQWCFISGWRIAGGFMWSWSHTHSSVKPLFKGKDNSRGPTWSALLEKDLSPKWSINIGAAYNRSLNHEKHGIKGQGVKLGLTYWF